MVAAVLEQMGKLHAVGGLAYLAQLALRVPTVDNAIHYAEIVRELADRRRLRRAASEIANKADLTSEELRAEMARLAHEVRSDPHATVLRASDLVQRILEQASRPKLVSGFPRLDQMVNGFRARSVTAVVAGIGQGKTSFALQIAAKHAEAAPVVYLGLELTREQLVARIIGQRTQRPWWEVLDAKIDAARMTEVLAPLALYLPERSDNPRAAIERALDVSQRERSGLPLIVIDYVQLMAHAAPDMRVATLAAVRSVLAMTEQADIVTWILSQGSRASAKLMREGGAQAAEDFVGVGAETSAIEASAANQLVLSFRKRDGQDVHDVTLNIAKARFGRTGRVGFRFDGPTGLWTEMERAPLTEAQERRREQIIDSLRAAGPGARLNKSTIRKRNGETWVRGSKTNVNPDIDSMAKDGLLQRTEGSFGCRDRPREDPGRSHRAERRRGHGPGGGRERACGRARQVRRAAPGRQPARLRPGGAR